MNSGQIFNIKNCVISVEELLNKIDVDDMVRLMTYITQLHQKYNQIAMQKPLKKKHKKEKVLFHDISEHMIQTRG